MINTYAGIALDFGANDLGFTSVTGTTIGTMKVQSFDVQKKAKVEAVADAGGTTISRTYYDKSWECTWEGVPFNATSIAAAQGQVILPEIGILCTSASTLYAWLNGLIFTVEDASIKATNTKNKIISLKLLYTPGITAIAGA